MGRKSMFLPFFAILGSSLGCVASRQVVPLPDQSVRVSNPSMARIYVVRPSPEAPGVQMPVRDGQRIIGMTGPCGFLCWEREPGTVELTSRSENISSLNLEVEAGKAYIIMQEVSTGKFLARNKLRLIPEWDGRGELKECHPPKIVESGSIVEGMTE